MQNIIMERSATATQRVQRTREMERRPSPPHHARQNVGSVERWLSGMLGSAMLLRAISKPSASAAAWVAGGGALLHRGVTGHCYIHRAIGRNTAQSGAQGQTRGERASVERSITIGRPAEELYRLWRDPQHVATLLGHIARIEAGGNGRLLWHVDLPTGKSLDWTTRTIEERPGELIAWRSEPGASIEHEGAVRFRPAPADRGTEVTLQLGFRSSGGILASLAGKWLRTLPKAFEDSVLRRCKNLCEAGEIPTLDHNSAARERGAVERIKAIATHANREN